MKRNDIVTIMTQQFYGNRVLTEVKRERIDLFVLGIVSGDFVANWQKVDRTIIHIPNDDNIVFIYNKYMEERRRKEAEDNANIKPSATIPELGVELFSRVIVCRIGDNGEVESLVNGDIEKFINYLAE